MIKSALFNFESLLVIILLVICSCAYIKAQYPAILESQDGTHNGYANQYFLRDVFLCTITDLLLRIARFKGLLWKAARIGMSNLRFHEEIGL